MLGHSDHEPPYTVPYVRWCERTRPQGLSYSIKREFFNYDEDKNCVLEIIDNGTSENPDDLTGVTFRRLRRITPSKTVPYGLPLVEEEFCLDIATGNYLPEKKNVNFYTPQGYLQRQDRYDANDQLAYSQLWVYDAMGRLTREINALGEEILYCYDQNGNKTIEHGPNGNLIKYSFYDAANRLTEVRELHPDRCLTTSFEYNLLGQKTKSTDCFGNATEYHYDDFGRLVAIVHPQVVNEDGQVTQPIERRAYDAFGNVTQKIDPRGIVTSTSYTLKGKPCHMSYPDGTEEYFHYFRQGPIKWQRERNGCYLFNQIDYQGRITRTDHYSPDGHLLDTTSTLYDAFNPIAEFDRLGRQTVYTYDSFGRKTSCSKEESLETYAYDALGRLAIKKVYYGYQEHEIIVYAYRYDLLDRLVEERVEDAFGNVFDKTAYAYDQDGNKIQHVTFGKEDEPEITTTHYTTYGKVDKIIDPEGHISETIFQSDHLNALGQRVLLEQTTDPEGNLTLIIKDALGRESQFIRKDKTGRITQQRETFYDVANNRCKLIEKVFGGEPKEHITIWTYDVMNRINSLKEAVGTAEEKTTQYIYNSRAQLESIIKPSGIYINHMYTPDCLLEHFWSSDNSFSYRYLYNENRDLSAVVDEVQNCTTYRDYDKNDHLIREQLATGDAISYCYDRLGRMISLKLPDQSSVEYVYEGPALKAIIRKSSANLELYRHTYDSYDQALNPLSQTLIGNAGTLTTTYDSKKRIRSNITQHTREVIPEGGFDKVGNLVKKELRDALGLIENSYSYDPLYQLTSELGHEKHSYTYDSLYNRLSKDDAEVTINALNQVIAVEEDLFTYDIDGNMTSSPNATYCYDALDRLISLTKDGLTTHYSYDSFNRRLTKKRDGKVFRYLYEGQNEIGCMSADKIIQFRVLGNHGLGAEIGSAVALELDGKVFSPIHDISGNLIALLDISGNSAETYRYTAFGEEQIFNSKNNPITRSAIKNPWRFSSKRFDEESALVCFGRRYYSPSLGRWITRDPIGYEAGPNLYAYVSNNPLTHFDLYGLLEEEGANFSFNIESFRENFSQACDFSFNAIKTSAVGLWNGYWHPIETFNSHTDECLQKQSIFKTTSEQIGIAANAYPLFSLAAMGLKGGFALATNGPAIIRNSCEWAKNGLPIAKRAFSYFKDTKQWSSIKNFFDAAKTGITAGKEVGLAKRLETIGKNAHCSSSQSLSLAKELKFADGAMINMARPYRYTPRHIMANAILNGKKMADPKGAINALKYEQNIFKNGKEYKLNVIFRENDKTILHFHYENL